MKRYRQRPGLTGVELGAARKAVRLSQTDLAQKAGIGRDGKELAVMPLTPATAMTLAALPNQPEQKEQDKMNEPIDKRAIFEIRLELRSAYEGATCNIDDWVSITTNLAWEASRLSQNTKPCFTFSRKR